LKVVSLLQACTLSQRRSAVVPKCLGTEVSWVRSVRLPLSVVSSYRGDDKDRCCW